MFDADTEAGVDESSRGAGGGGVLVHVSASDGGGGGVSEVGQQMTMTKTVVIAMSCVVAYLGVMAALTVYCLIHMVRARRLRKLHNQQSDERQYKQASFASSSSSSRGLSGDGRCCSYTSMRHACQYQAVATDQCSAEARSESAVRSQA